MRARELTEAKVDIGIVKFLQKKGYRLLGTGADQRAFLEPTTNMILKIFGTSRAGTGSLELTPGQITFKLFADYCAAHPDNNFLPHFSGWEKFIYNNQIYLQIRMERLFEFKSNPHWTGVLEDIASEAQYATGEASKQRFIDSNVGTPDDYEYNPAAQELFTHLGTDGFNELWDTIRALTLIAGSNGIKMDLHSGNFMLGSDGHIVISDPFFIGWGNEQ